MIWLLIILALVAYVAADAAWDISKKISRWFRLWALPFLRSVWGAVAGAVPKRAAPASAKVSPGISADMPVGNVPSSLEDKPAASARSVPDAGQVFSFLWKARWLWLVLTLFAVGASIIGGFGWGKSKGELRLEREIAEANTRIAEHEAALGALSGQLAENAARDRARRDRVIAQTQQELTDAVEASDFDRLHSAYERGTLGLWNDLDPADRSDPAPSRASPMRRPRGDAA